MRSEPGHLDTVTQHDRAGPWPGPPAVAHRSRRLETCLGGHADARGETPLQRVDRAYGEILQEVRVAQTGVQILFAFLLTLTFTSRFATITPFQRNIYVLTLMLCAATALLIAPAAFHRVVYRRRLKQRLVHVANQLALSGLVLLLLAMVSVLLLILDVAIGLGPALLLAVGALTWFVTWWFVVPVWNRLRHQACGDAIDAPDEGSQQDT
jgi:hypothetical protein